LNVLLIASILYKNTEAGPKKHYSYKKNVYCASSFSVSVYTVSYKDVPYIKKSVCFNNLRGNEVMYCPPCLVAL